MTSLYKTPKQDIFRGRHKETKTPTFDGFNVQKKVLKSRNVTPSRNMDFKGATEGDRYVPQHSQDHIDYARVAFKVSPTDAFSHID